MRNATPLRVSRDTPEPRHKAVRAKPVPVARVLVFNPVAYGELRAASALGVPLSARFERGVLVVSAVLP